MKVFQFLALAIIGLLTACVSDNSNQTNGVSSTDSLAVQNDSVLEEKPVLQPNCDLNGVMLEGNEKWFPDARLLVRILATEKTKDPRLGDSHRFFEVLDDSCHQIFSEELDVDQSPDFPYTLSKIAYNKVNGWMAIQGYSEFYLFHLPSLKLSKTLKPSFKNERYAEDAQSGRINRLEVWEDYLVGHAEDMGTFVFNLDASGPKPVMPLAEYSADGGFEYHSLFMLATGQNAETYQLLAPSYNATSASFEINPLLDKPIRIASNVNPAFRNNRYLILKGIAADGKQFPVAIDMLLQKRVDLPSEIAGMKDTDIINWLQSNS